MRRSVGCGVRVPLVCACLLTLTFAVTQVHALTIGCERVWTGPSAQNDVATCLSNRQRIGDYWKYYVYPGFAALFFVLLLIVFPICYFVCICNGACCRTCCFPTSAAQHYNGPCCLYISAFVAILWGAGATVAIIMGAHTMHSGTRTAIDNFRHKSALYYNDTANQVVQYLVVDGVIAPSISDNIHVVFDVYNRLITDLDDFDRKYLKYLDDAAIVSYCLGWMPFVLLLFTMIFGLCRIARCVPACFSCIYYIVGLVFALLAVVFLVAAYFSSAFTGEVDRQVAREPGILQWYAVPYFATHFKAQLESLDENIADVVAACVASACASINSYCDDQPAFSTTKPFFCSAAVTCTTFKELVQAVSTVLVKQPGFCTPYPDDSPDDTTCTIAFCATNCLGGAEGSDIAAARSASVEVMQNVQTSKNATIARNLVTPMQDPDMIADTLLWSTETFPEIREGFWMAGTGYFLSIFVFALGIYTMLRGRVVWGEYVERRKEL
ncbi:uncharacterized protein Tco025E_02238 [Trypanosoma conorhini]|uniref:Uncharacterized protein n=1 Tax=Trypanosoma conorhini TaxID=83891 RepID=A0A3R7NQ73_9TRYP|nr:uncharacterized protein Tco025E_02238 [Trypanosoma conorhini]RNF25355.1 hypothetical protein Tco025E_02238 [Trypanosoma conorhini]